MRTTRHLPLLALLVSTVPGSGAHADEEELEAIRAAIEAAGAEWQAGHTGVSGLSPEERRALVGAVPLGPPQGATLERHDGHRLPASFDWRDHGGENWMTPIRTQDVCGACWAFAAVALMEATHNITAGVADWDPDLSEQILVSCSGGGCGGWYLEDTVDFLEQDGTQTESCMPYQASDGVSCNSACGAYSSQPWRIDGWTHIGQDTASIKAAIQVAPIAVYMTAYEDFVSYTGGVYEHVWGGNLGGHIVVLTGWDNADQCWIGKNSWGDWWGEDTDNATGEAGWFRIRWGDSDIGTLTPPVRVSVPGCSCNDNDGDGYQSQGCNDPLCPLALDCDNGDASIHPGAAEQCDGEDNDCDGVVPADEADADGDGWMVCEGDCDDGHASDHPGAAEACDGHDNDCDGTVPDDEIDHDGDGIVACDGDCDPHDGDVHPGATEVCGNGVDEDCDGTVDDPDVCGGGDDDDGDDDTADDDTADDDDDTADDDDDTADDDTTDSGWSGTTDDVDIGPADDDAGWSGTTDDVDVGPADDDAGWSGTTDDVDVGPAGDDAGWSGTADDDLDPGPADDDSGDPGPTEDDTGTGAADDDDQQDGDGARPPGAAMLPGEGGCECSSGASPGPGWIGLLGLWWLLRPRRRCREP